MVQDLLIHAILITYMRPDGLMRATTSLARQVRKPDTLYLFDNAPSAHGEDIAEDLRAIGLDTSYIPSTVNVGPAGAAAEAMARVLSTAADDEWIMVLNDDVEFTDQRWIARLEAFASDMVSIDPQVAGVGKIGHRFDWSRAMLVRPAHEEIVGPVDVDYLATGFGPMFRVGAVRRAGPIRADLFFGLEEVEFGLRLRRSGFRLVAAGDLWNPSRTERKSSVSRVRVQSPAWHRYYKLRNLIVILRDGGRIGTALQVSLVRGLLKPLANVPLAPRPALQNLRMNVCAICDGWRGRMGMRYQPAVNRATDARL